MAAMWRRYGHPLRMALVACAVAFAGATGATIVTGFADYRMPWAQWALWAACAALYVAVAWRTRTPSQAPVLLLATLLVANAASAVDPEVGGPATAWVPNLIGAALTLVAFTAPVRRTVLLLTVSMVSNGLLIALRYAAGEPAVTVASTLATGNAGMLTGVLPSLMIMLALRDHALREADQRSRTRTAQAAREAELAVHSDRRAVLEPALEQVRQTLSGLASGRADPADPQVRAGCGAAERRLRAALLTAVDESALSMLALQILAASGSRVEVVVQGGPDPGTLPEGVQAALVELLHRVVEAPATSRINLTLLPDEGRLWLSLTVDGGSAVDDLPVGLDRPSARGRVADQWWLEWTVPQATPAPARAGGSR